MRAVLAKASPGLTPRAKQLYEELAAENSRVLTLDNIVDGYYISPKFLDKVRNPCRPAPALSSRSVLILSSIQKRDVLPL
jgi:hypothetical protein